MGGKKPGKRGQELIKLGVRVGQHTEPFLNRIQDLGLGSIEEFLQTGGVGSQVPAIRVAREGASDAVSQGLKQTQESLASAGLSRSPYAAAILGEQKMRGGLAVSQSEQAAINNYLTGILPNVIQQPVNSIGPILGVPNAPLAAGAAQTAAAGQSAAGLYGAGGEALGTILGAYLNRPASSGIGATYGGGAATTPYTVGGGPNGSYGD